MRIVKGSTVLCCCWLLLAFLSSSVAAQGYAIAPSPQWVVSVQAPTDDWVETAPRSNGVAYLLVDRQWSMVGGRERHFNHFVMKAMSASGVEKVSGISVDFDPLFESLTLHGISVWRDGEVMDRLDRSRIDLIQREKELEYQLYDGSLTLNVILEDIRPGDTVEYSYTIEGANPIFAGHFSRRLKLQWDVPVGRVNYRLVRPQASPLYVRNYETSISPIKRSFDGTTEYIWRLDRVASQVVDDDTPSWYDPLPKIYLSDISSWDEVVAWALPLYRSSSVSQAEQEVIDSLGKPGSTQEERLLAALSFVQQQIRYLGLEMGENSHKPSLPGEVLERRYGDCKDKTRLLISLLREMGIEAYPALVNTATGARLKDALPSLHTFNHVIVKVRLQGKSFWLDPTRTHQAGDLSTIYQPDYDYALVVAEQGGGLQFMSDDIDVVHGKRVDETFDIVQGPEQPVVYRIETEFNHYYADSLREQLAESDLSAIQKSYLNYTARYYPSVELADDIQVIKAKDKNAIKLIENYRIPKAWKPMADSSYVAINFEPFLIDDHIDEVQSPKRTAPYSVRHPVRYQHTTRIRVPPNSQFEEEYYEINDSAFRFEKSVKFTGDELTIKYDYESLRGYVMPVDIGQHAKNLRNIYKLSSYQVRMMDPAISFGEYRPDPGDVNWLLVGPALLVMALTFLLSYKLIYLRDSTTKAPENIDSKLSGLRGWLIVPGISIFLFPFLTGWGMRELMFVFSAVQWSALLEDVGPGLLTLIICEVMLNIVMIVVSLFVIVMFVTKRCGFPKLFITFYVFVLLVNGVDLLAIKLLSVPGVELELEDIRQFVRILVFTVIWGSYFAVSKRVKATFIKSRNGKAKRWQGDLAPQHP